MDISEQLKKLPMPSKGQLKRISELKVDESDVFLTGYPKSGNTWMEEMVWLIVNDLNYEKAKRPIQERVPFLERTVEKLEENAQQQLPLIYSDAVGYVEGLEKPRTIKTHLAWKFLPKDIQEGRKRPKIVHVTRDPRDTAVSVYHYCKPRYYSHESFEQFCEAFLTVDDDIYGYWKVVHSYWKRRGDGNVLLVKFEDMKDDLKGVIERMAAFFGKSFAGEQIEGLVKHLGFEAMRDNDAVNKNVKHDFEKKVGIIKDYAPFMRSGRTGEHRVAMSEEMVGKYDEWIERNCADMRMYCKALS